MDDEHQKQYKHEDFDPTSKKLTLIFEGEKAVIGTARERKAATTFIMMYRVEVGG